ncbi:hypothetical protein [Bosea lathyri]|uniref:hypothetical protein n=1 Tax=Bosea lathyri TaxID=1036778 RepID=UPI0011B0B9F1|nr:hypothetical protein [Bosea lathyri]
MRAAVLMGCVSGGEEERELDALTDAIAEYDMRTIVQAVALAAAARCDAGEFEQSAACAEVRHMRDQSPAAACADVTPFENKTKSTDER